MTREEALKIAKNWVKTEQEKEVLEALIPELCESEDERIIKRLSSLVNVLNACFFSGDNPSKEECLAYLEKQKGLTTENNMISSKKYNKSPLTDEAFKEQLERVLRNNVLDTDIRITGDTVIGAKQKEQKPDDDPLNDPKFLKGFDTGREVQRIFDEKKPAEWNEEDEHNLNSVINLVNNTSDGAWGSCIGDRIENWLKSLPERFNLQPKQEWSEEDEKIITQLIGYFESFRIAGVATKWEGLGVQEVITLLKSLRPSWKPSEEQIYSLGAVVKGAGENSVGSVAYNLKELYEELKKL